MASLAGSIAIAVGPSTKGFWTKFNADIKKNPPKVDVKVNPDLTRLRNEINAERKRQELNAISLKVDLDKRSVRGVENQLRRIEHVWKGSAWTKAVRVNLYVAGAASLPSMISGLMSLTTAVTQLGRAALVLPGIFSGLAASVGTFATGIIGVTEAIKESNNSLDNAAQKSRMYERATRDLERAQRDVVQALKDANREIEDQKNKLTQNQLSVEQAQLNLRKANARVSRGGFETNDDYRQAILDQKRAQLELSDVVKQSKRDIQDYYDTAKKGATESDTFKDSVDRLNTAIEEFTKKQTEAAGASEKFLQAMKSLSPNAKDFVLQILSLKNAWQDLQLSVSDKLFDGLGKAVTDLAQSRLPMLRKGMQDLASGLNNDIKGMIESIGKDANANSISKIFERTASALNIIRPGLDSLITGFVKLSEVGSRFLPRLATAFNAVADRFEKFIDRADKDGSLERWINQGLNLVSSLGRSLISVGSIFGSITRSYEKATGNIGGLASTVERQLKKWADTLASPSGQRALTEWINKAKDFIGEIRKSLPGIKNLFQAIGDGAREFATRVFPVFAALGNFLEKNAVLAQNLFLLYAGMRTLKPIANIFSKIKDPLIAGRNEFRAVIEERRRLNDQLILQEKERDTQAIERLRQAKEIRAAEDANLVAAQRASAFAKIEQSTKVSQGKLEIDQAARRVRAKEEELAAARRQAQLSAEAVAVNRRNLDLITDIGASTDISNEPRGRGSTTRGAGGRFVSRDSVPQETGDFYDAAPQRRGYYSQEEGRFVQFTSPATGFTDRIEELKRFRRAQSDLVRDLTSQQDEIFRVARETGSISPQQSTALQAIRTRLVDEQANLDALNMAVNGKKGSLEEARRISFEQTAAASAREAADIKRVAQLEEELDASRRGYGRTQLSVSQKNLEASERYRGSLDDLAVVEGKVKDAAKLQADAGDEVVKSMNRSSEATNRLGGAGRLTSSVVQRLEGNFPRLADKIEKTSRAIGIGGSGNRGLAGRLGGLLGMIGNVAGAIAGVAGFAGTIGLMFALDKLADAHQKAGDRAEYQRSRLEALRNQIDPTTGAVTQAAISEALDQAADFSVTGDENRKIPANPITAANKLGISAETLGASLNPINLDAINQVQAASDKSTVEAIRSGKDEQWNRFGKQLQENGVTPEIYARAINGDQEAIAKFKAAEDGIFRARNGGTLFDPFDLKRRAMGAVGDLPNLGLGAENLVGAGVPGVALGQYQRSSLGAFREGGDNTKQARRPAVLKPGNPFPGAQDAKWQPDGNGVSFVMNNLSAQQRAALENLGASTEPTGNLGRYIVSIGGDLLEKYVEPAGFAAGGPVWGAGSATSDSIPAMLSNGEFVINAKSASLIGHDTLNRMNSTNLAASSPVGIKKFAPGGVVEPYDPNQPWWRQAQGWLGAAGYIPTQLPQIPTLPPAPIKYGPFVGEGQNPPVKEIPILRDERPKVSELVRNAPLNGFPHIFAGQPGPGGAKSSPGVAPMGSPYAVPDLSSPASLIPPITNGRIPRYEQLPGLASSGAASAPGPSTSSYTNEEMEIARSLAADRANIEGYREMLRGNAPGSMSPGVKAALSSILGMSAPVVLPSPIPGVQTVAPANGGPAVILPPEGGMTLGSFAALADSLPYVYGSGHPGHHPGSDSPLVNGFDCSSLASYVANLATGRPLNSNIFGTSNQRAGLESRGFIDGPGGPGDLTIGWTDANGGHTSMTLPDGRNLEAANKDAGILLGDAAASGSSFPFVMHLPGAAINPELLSDSAPALMPDISTLTPPPGAVTGPKKGRGEGGIPGINAPIPGPFGDLPIEPMDLLKQIGEALLTGILGFFGIDASSIIRIINDIFGGFADREDNQEAEVDGGAVPEENPSPAVDPGPDPKIVQQLVQAAADAKARGDEPLARNYLQRAREYQRSRLAESAQPSTLGSLTLESQQADVAKAILSEARSRGYTKEEAQAILSTAIGTSQLNPRGLDKEGNWTGIFPLAKNAGEQIPGSVDPNQNIAAFFDGMREQSDQGADIWQSIFYASSGAGSVYTQGDASKPRDPKLLEAALSYMQATGYARGGSVRGPGTGTSDSIPAMLSNGEFVMRADAVKHWGEGHLNAMNSGGLVRGYAPGGSVDAQGNTGLDLLQAEFLRLALRGELPQQQTVYGPPLPGEDKLRGRGRGGRFGGRGPIRSGAQSEFLPVSPETTKKVRDVTTAGYWFPDLLRQTEPDRTAIDYRRGNRFSGQGGVAPRERRRYPGERPGTSLVSILADTPAIPDITETQKILDDPNASFGSQLLAMSEVIAALPLAGAPIKAVTTTAKVAGATGRALNAGIGEINRSFGFGAGAAGAVGRASGIERRAALADVTMNTGRAGFYGRRQIRNAIADLMVAFPDVNLDRVSMRSTEELLKIYGDPDIASSLAMATHNRDAIILNSDFFGKGNLGRLRRAVRSQAQTGFTPDLGFRDDIFNVISHEFGHRADITTNGPDIDAAYLRDSLHAKLFRIFESENPGIRNAPNQGSKEFADWIREAFYGYSYLDGGKFSKDDFWGPIAAMDALDSLSRPEALANAFNDVSASGKYASRGSKILFDFLSEEARVGSLGAGVWRDLRSISARGRGPGWGSGKSATSSLSPEALATRNRFAGPITGAVGGDFTAPNPLLARMYDKNMLGKMRKSKWFGLPGRGAKGEMESMVANILARYNDTIGDKAWIRDSGMSWYSDAREWFLKLMDDSGVDWTLDQAGAALAALSGNSGWNANMASAIKFFGDPSSLSLDQPGVQAALRAIKSDDPMAALGEGADKWRHFAASILGRKVDGIDPVAVDRWAARAALGTTDAKLAERAMGRKIDGVPGKTIMGDAYREAAKRAGIDSEQMQAVVWMHTITPPEAAMWEDITKFISSGRWPWRDEVTFGSGQGGVSPRSSKTSGGPKVNQEFPRSKSGNLIVPGPGQPLSYWDAASVMDESYGIGVEDWYGPLFTSDKLEHTPEQVKAIQEYSRSSWANKVMRGAEDLPGIQKVLSDLIAIRPKMSGAGGYRPGLVGDSGVADVADLYGNVIGTPLTVPKRGVNFTKLVGQETSQIDQLKELLYGGKRRSVAEANASPAIPDPQTIIERIVEMLQPSPSRIARNEVSMERGMLELLGPDASDEEMQYFLMQARTADKSRKRSAGETGPTTQQVWEDIFHGFLKEARLRAVKTMRYLDQARLLESAMQNGPGLPFDMWVTRMIEAGDPSLTKVGELSPANPGFSSTSVGISRSLMDNPLAWERSPVFSDRDYMQQILFPKGTPGIWMGGRERELIGPRFMQFLPQGYEVGRQVDMRSPSGKMIENWYPPRKKQQRVYGEAVFPDVMPDLNDIGLEGLMGLLRSLGLLKRGRDTNYALQFEGPRGWQDLMAEVGNGGLRWDPMESDVEIGKLKFASGGHVRGPGSGTSDSIPAMLSHGEFVMKADAVKHWGVNRLNAMNSIPRFSEGGLNLVPGLTPPVDPIEIPPVEQEMPLEPAPDPGDLSSVPDLNRVIEENPGAALAAGEIASRPAPTIGGSSSAGAGQPRGINPRAKLGAAPTSTNHVNPALAMGIKGAISTIGNIASTAAQAGMAASTFGASAAVSQAPGAGQLASSIIGAGTQIAGDLAVGAANVVSSLLVGTVTPSETSGGYGAPLLPQQPQGAAVSNFQSIHNGNVVTNNLSEYSRLRDRKDAQKAAPFFNRVNQ